MKTNFLPKTFCSLAFLAMCIFSQNLKAQTIIGCGPKKEKGTVLVFTNGVDNPSQTATQGVLDTLSEKVPLSQLDKPGLTSSYLAYNHGDRYHEDVLEAYKQKVGERYADYMNYYANFSLAPPAFKKIIQDFSAKYLVQKTTVDEPRFKVHLAAMNAFLLEGKRIIHVTHSQGNFFANGVYTTLKQKGLHVNAQGVKTYENIQVASPASAVLSGGSHFTFANDIVEPILKIASKRGWQEKLSRCGLNVREARFYRS